MARTEQALEATRPHAATSSLHLTRVRERKGVSLEQIAANTKISTRFLIAIEAEEFHRLPGGVFNTSYLRQYAAAIGYEEEELLAHYRETIQPEETLPEAGCQPAHSEGLLSRCFRVLASAPRP
ncbi:MAG TPA: helix-turn-helix transcriptional regulator [Verrucomicrobiae bacterium]|nr:helix-turn-helix transcriptional regulator [Verrucomicrobiae bacterium]